MRQVHGIIRKVWREVYLRNFWRYVSSIRPSHYRFDKAQSEWKNIPIDEIGYLSSVSLLSKSDEELRQLTRKFEDIRYDEQGWRNHEGLWRRYSGIETVRNKTILDFGCGFGIEALQFAKENNRVSLADISAENLWLAERVLNLYGFEAEELVIASNEDPFFECKTPVDVFYANGVLHHTPRIREILLRARRFLNPGGEIRLMLYSDIGWKIATGTEAPPPDAATSTHPRFLKFVRFFDSVGEYADWYSEEKLDILLGDFLRITDFHYIAKDQRYLMVTLTPKEHETDGR